MEKNKLHVISDVHKDKIKLAFFFIVLYHVLFKRQYSLNRMHIFTNYEVF